MFGGMRVVLTCLLVLAAPASASAATLDKTGPTLTYTAGAGRANQPVFASPAGQPGTVTVTDDVNDPIQATGCTPIAGGYSCPGIQLVVVNAGDGDDVVQAAGLGTAAQLNGGAGDDQLFAGAGADSLGGGDGDDLLEGGGGNDILDGGGDDDQLDGGTGTDKLIGGTGIDLGAYDAVAATPAPAISLDGVANDGVPGENDDFEADIEDVSVSGVGPASSTVIGSAAPNTLTTGAGNDTIVGGAGADNITSGAGDDTIDARDGA